MEAKKNKGAFPPRKKKSSQNIVDQQTKNVVNSRVPPKGGVLHADNDERK